MAVPLAKVQKLDEGVMVFRAEARLLQELGERLVAQPEVALVELIKNSYDADSTQCDVEFSGEGDELLISDNGHGMTKDEFEQRWMTIATSFKATERRSRIHGRELTGQKGIGRFAVRFLAGKLRVSSTAFDKQRNSMTRLVADFDWQEIDRNPSLTATSIPFRLFKAPSDAKPGTVLRLMELRRGGEFASTPSFRSGVLNIVSPLSGLNRGRFKSNASKGGNDSGFRVSLPGHDATDSIDVASYVLENYWARISIDLQEDSLTYSVQFSNDSRTYSLKLRHQTQISAGLHADIRYFPRRAGLFANKGIDGRTAYTWVRENSGVVVVDRGFRVKPYGDADDDWLLLDRDAAHNVRDWRTAIGRESFPMSAREKSDPALNPVLNLPANHQLVGAVFVKSAATSKRNSEDIIPSTDREGFLRTDGFKDLCEIVRGGIEFLAKTDKARQLEEIERSAKEAANRVRADYKAAIAFVQSVPTLSPADKSRLVKDYSALSQKIEEIEGYDREARRKLEVMGSLGVVAGFLTHEASRIVATIKGATSIVENLSVQHTELKTHAAELKESYLALKSHLEYTNMFVDATHNFKAVTFKSAPQVRRVIEKFGRFADERGVSAIVDIQPDVMAPAMPVTIYSGILLNLYTNALKAVLARENSDAHAAIKFAVSNTGSQHIVDVLDTGIGIPENIQSRIWDPLFTTTSRTNNPLGSGMGLGLSLVRQLVEQVGGRISLLKPVPSPFTTCFRIVFPLSANK